MEKKRRIIVKDILMAVDRCPHYPDLPGSVYIGLDCVDFLRGLGYEAIVMMVYRGFDRDMVNLVKAEMEVKGVQFLLDTIPLKVSQRSDGKLLHERHELTPLKIQTGKLFVARLNNGNKEQMDYDNVATTVFSPLEYGYVGFTEDEAINRFTEDKIEVYHTYYKLAGFITPKKNVENYYL
ncbi:FAD/NAD-linked reductase, dimerisation domain,FAD/NAD(P)-binding domain [Cinara cedri]|uniref:FAD/NAD-linked reductase, dimerisation domain,FAD/NAD(P)-binding domain n=1 Tax=Cinara cedri TaxID=506608 RepID=A0A5E4M6J0_9HEMI|nr:FAD/NAD-linked reductase, dimerisation domain,FAD/NAD(P)-binding domain [Cinara cedri]